MQGKPQISGQAIPAFGLLFSSGAKIQRLCTGQIIGATVLWQGMAAFGSWPLPCKRRTRTATILRLAEGEEFHAFRKVFETSRDPLFPVARDDNSDIREN